MAGTEQGAPLPTTDNLAAIARETVGDVTQGAIAVAESALITYQPWLGWPVIKQVWESLFSYFVSQFGQALGVLSGYAVVDAQEYFALRKAAHALANLNAAKASGDKDALDKASAQVDEAVTPVLHYIGDSRPH